MMYKQIPLSMPLSEEATFENFYISENNRLTISALRDYGRGHEPFFYLWGTGGISHALQALQHEQSHRLIQYLPLKELMQYPSNDVLSGLETVDVVMLDDLQCIAGNADWEQQVFHLYNRLRDAQKQLIVGAKTAPRELSIQLADLQSRLQWGISYRLYELSDEEKQQAIKRRAQNIGLRISDDVIQYVFTHYSRDLVQLMRFLKRMDEASMAEQRHLTIPFVKQILGC